MYVEELSDQAIAVVTGQLPRKTSPLSVLLFYGLDGASPRSVPTRPPLAGDGRRDSPRSSSGWLPTRAAGDGPRLGAVLLGRAAPESVWMIELP
jgi:hypothetical protein